MEGVTLGVTLGLITSVADGVARGVTVAEIEVDVDVGVKAHGVEVGEPIDPGTACPNVGAWVPAGGRLPPVRRTSGDLGGRGKGGLLGGPSELEHQASGASGSLHTCPVGSANRRGLLKTYA